jgi:hypothetical protein
VKKILARILIALMVLPNLFLPAGAMAQGAPAALSNAVNPEYTTDRNIARGTLDSLMGAADSTTIFSQLELSSGWEYILSRGAVTGSTDSVKVALRLDVLDPNEVGITLQSIYIDSFTASAGEQITLPVGKTVLGSRFTLKALSYTDNGAKVKLNRLILWKRKAVR